MNTAFVLIGHIHWMDGTRFELKKIATRCREVNAFCIVDGSQSTGALPINVEEFGVSALISACYKWLFGPYSISLGYYGPEYDTGKPIEESWMNRIGAMDFSNLSDYTSEYKPSASRYSVGEGTYFTEMPMLIDSLQHLLEWQPQNIQAYCKKLTAPLLHMLEPYGIEILPAHERAEHLFSIALPDSINPTQLLQELRNRNIILSLRGRNLRISPNVYNTEKDVRNLGEALLEHLN